MTSVQYQMAIAALDRLVDAGGPFMLSVQIGAPVRREKRVIRVVNSLILLILMHSPLSLSGATRFASSIRRTSAPEST